MPTEPALQYRELMHWGRCDAASRLDISGLRPDRYYAAAATVALAITASPEQ
jgi:hypothetical protein